mgnify:CR=1 FL=1
MTSSKQRLHERDVVAADQPPFIRDPHLDESLFFSQVSVQAVGDFGRGHPQLLSHLREDVGRGGALEQACAQGQRALFLCGSKHLSSKGDRV